MKKAGLFYRFKVAALLLTIFLITPNGLAYAQEDQIILCPINEVTAGIMTQLPEDWWNTPQIGRLSGVQIRQLGGEPLLTCLYIGLRQRDRCYAAPTRNRDEMSDPVFGFKLCL